ncbi:hypothetical protein [Vibrio breoganii]|uniref:hypothetical protein n=1 Tax=Vibrio breoganii TaxID=553239 RepID=UPI000C84811E|nr:hypothetical protein [Vibrio breoganii]PMK30662.1 hypothetical protein BCU03_09610 [Vibrio breoganii]
MNPGNDFKAAWETMIDVSGSDFTYKASDGSTGSVRMFFMIVGKDDETLINALGLDARIAAIKPEIDLGKYTIVTSPTGKTYNVEASHEVLVDNVLVGYRLYLL